MQYEQMKSTLNLCTGTRQLGYSAPCHGTLYKCTSCGHTGCKQTKDNACSGQGFSMLGKCYACGGFKNESLPE